VYASPLACTLSIRLLCIAICCSLFFFIVIPPPPSSTLFPYTTLFRSEPDLTIPGHPEISVVGDLMSRDHLPGVAEVAMQSGSYAGRRIRRRAEGRRVGPFRYLDLGSAAYLSRGNAVVSAGPAKFAGLPGWFAWLVIHIAFLTGYRNRVGAVLTWAAAFARDARRERAFTTQQIERLRDVYGSPQEGERPPVPS